METYRKLPDIDAAKEALARSIKLQGDIWTSAIAVCHDLGSQFAYMLFLPALNKMIDLTTIRLAATRNHPPLVIYILLAVLSLIGSLLAGNGMSGNKDRRWFHMAVFTTMLSLTVYVIMDLEFPRLGLIRLDTTDQLLIELRKSMH